MLICRVEWSIMLTRLHSCAISSDSDVSNNITVIRLTDTYVWNSVVGVFPPHNTVSNRTALKYNVFVCVYTCSGCSLDNPLFTCRVRGGYFRPSVTHVRGQSQVTDWLRRRPMFGLSWGATQQSRSCHTHSVTDKSSAIPTFPTLSDQTPPPQRG